MTICAETIAAKSEKAVYRMVDGEAVVVEPQNGLVNVVNETGSRIWELIDGMTPVKQISEIISTEFDISRQTALNDTVEFIDDLAAKNIVDIRA